METKKTFSKEEKQEYFKKLRLDWKRSKALAENDMEAEALYRESGLTGVSYFSFYFVLKQMKGLKMEGLPYVNCKTFAGWHKNGFKVKKGEKSNIKGITWIKIKEDGKVIKNKDDQENIKFMYPKVYHLFHTSQVEAL